MIKIKLRKDRTVRFTPLRQIKTSFLIVLNTNSSDTMYPENYIKSGLLTQLNIGMDIFNFDECGDLFHRSFEDLLPMVFWDGS